MSEDLTSFADSLRQCQPADTLDRDAVLYEAGRAAARTGWAWPLATAAVSVLACTLGAMLWLQPEPTSTERVVYVPIPAEPSEPLPSVPSVPPESYAVPQLPAPLTFDDESMRMTPYRQLQDHISRWGLAGLPPMPPPSAKPKPEDLDKFLNSL